MKTKLVLSLTILLIFSINGISATLPEVLFPHAFYGEITCSDGSSINSGTIIAEIDETIEDTAEISSGKYGYDGSLIVTSMNIETINFYLEDNFIGSYLFEPLGITKLDFVIDCKEEDEETCGDGILDSSEECDDGNTISDDGCSSTCKSEEEENTTSSYKKYTTITSQECVPNWKCTAWTECNEDGFMERTCTDESGCSFSYNKPTEIAGCELQNALIDKEYDMRDASIFIFLAMGVISLALLFILIALMKLRKKR